jgi:hypothetical protein
MSVNNWMWVEIITSGHASGCCSIAIVNRLQNIFDGVFPERDACRGYKIKVK